MNYIIMVDSAGSSEQMLEAQGNITSNNHRESMNIKCVIARQPSQPQGCWRGDCDVKSSCGASHSA